MGGAIRKLRLAKGLTLADLSRQTGIPLSTLSRLELGQNSLNYDKLTRLCRALEVDLQGLVVKEAAVSAGPSGRRAVIRAGDGVAVQTGSGPGRQAAADLLDKTLSPVIVDVTARALASHGPYIQAAGEAYALVLTGEIVFHGPLYAPLPMAAGDGVYFDGDAGCALVAPSGPAKVLLVAAGQQDFQT